jgi:ATP-dependent DNA helicase DinG
MKEEPGANPRAAALFSVIGGFAPRIKNIKHTAEMLMNEGEEARTTAKWCSADTDGPHVSLHLHACPILPGELLMYNLWPKVRGAVLTSATLSSCGSFDYYMEESGLAQDPAARTLAVKSPFDYARQGSIVVAKTRAHPRSLAAYNTEVAGLLTAAIGRIEKGALALFTSRRHMEEALEAVPSTLRDRVLVQGSMSRAALLAEHSRRVESGLPSMLFGMQSFGEGLDLPGALCEDIFVAKLPFSQPTDPVTEARAEYVESLGGNSFDDIVVPAAGVRMLQWTGRGIRTETDIARITCFDRRLTEKDFGRRILKGLPPYPVRVLSPPAAPRASGRS